MKEGDYLRTIRRLAGLRQEDLASLLSSDQTVISKREHGIYGITPDLERRWVSICRQRLVESLGETAGEAVIRALELKAQIRRGPRSKER